MTVERIVVEGGRALGVVANGLSPESGRGYGYGYGYGYGCY